MRWIIILLVLVMNVGCDQVSKKLVRDTLEEYETVQVVKDYFVLTKIENSGAFLSLGDTLPQPWKFILLTFFPVMVLTAALLYLFTERNIPKASQLAICLVVGGGIGNIYDRMMYGSVTDFMHIDLGVVQTGVFNIADVSIMAGMALILVSTFRQRGSWRHDGI